MVYAFIIQTLDAKECSIMYYRTFTCYNANSIFDGTPCSKSEVRNTVRDVSNVRSQKAFETSIEMKEFLQHIANKVHMQYTMKMKHSFVPILDQGDCKDTFLKGIYMERKGKEDNVTQIPIVWQCTPGLGFVLVCNKSDNCVQAQNVLDVIVQQLEKHLQFVSNPPFALALVEAIALVINQYLPGGQLLFMNNKLMRQFEKQLETDLFSKRQF
ncbi:hypothetical protein C0J52_25976 [Blattella germanica]|nr:hypothetical protein C0J52_25976 [Blattella germanica]